jgi:N-acetylmuramoyl-L-alanine amidase
MLALGAALAVAAGAAVAAARDAVGGGPPVSGVVLEPATASEAPAAAASAAVGERAPAAAPPRLRVMLDPGHGGSNLGAPSVRPGLSEKHLTLALAFGLRRELEARGVEVWLTRERDEYLSLRERVRRANSSGADLFVSLHLNATEDHAQRGYETWILTPRALDVDARALRATDGPIRRGVDPALAALLDDVERGAALPGAARLAGRIQRAVAAVRGPGGDRGVRQGSQDVLMGATMPAVLVELGFVDHPVEGDELLDGEVRAALARAMAEAIAAEG